MKGYGHIDEQTPELSIALLKAYRHQGLGSLLIYQKLAFKIYSENDDEAIMFYGL